jgi:hypothetical protein
VGVGGVFGAGPPPKKHPTPRFIEKLPKMDQKPLSRII